MFGQSNVEVRLVAYPQNAGFLLHLLYELNSDGVLWVH